ncbi:MAG TPA: M20 family metallopeptidase [Thermomicrobiales bacterium]|nr:M20 family metallopeptidase [Thermomicrobiales bacterium]
MADVQTYHAYLRDQQAALVDELGRYAAIESGSREKAGVDRVGEAVGAAFAGLGFTIERIPEADCGDHLVARRAGGGRGRLLALIHLDTTWPSGSLAENPVRVENGRVYGPGARDMKGGWVVLLGALRALSAAGWDGLASTTVFMTGDEELGSTHGRPWIEREARQADWALVMEPARENGDLVTSRGMVGAVYYEVRGVAIHNTARERGASAIAEAAYKILALEALTDIPRGVLVNVGLVEGGTARQILADRVRMSIDLRAPGVAEADDLLARVREIAGQTTVPSTSTIMTGGITRPAFGQSPGATRLLQLAQACGRELGLTPDGAYTRAGSDGNFTAALGVPTLDGLGPESDGRAGRGEHVLADSLPRRAALLAGIIAGLPGLLGGA